MSKEPYIAVEEDGTCWSDDALICPHCHKPQSDLCEIKGSYTEDGGETNCDSCTKLFTFFTCIKYSWTTRKPREKSHE